MGRKLHCLAFVDSVIFSKEFAVNQSSMTFLMSLLYFRYCMRVMMEDVPEKEWLCEDCETMVESEKEKKLEKSQAKVGTSKGQSFEGEMNKAAKSRSSDSELVAQNVDNNESDTANKRNDMVKNRMEASSIRDTISETGDAYMGADTRKRMSSSRESSFGYDADKGKQPSQVGTSLTSNAPKNQAPQPRGKLLILLFSDLDSLHRILNVQFMVFPGLALKTCH